MLRTDLYDQIIIICTITFIYIYSFQALMQVLKNRIIKIESFTRSPSKIKGLETLPDITFI